LADSAQETAVEAKDRQIIRELQKDGRLTNQELAERVNLSPSPCLRRVRNLEAEGVITGYTALVDQKAYGLPITVFVRVRLDRHGQDLIKGFEAAVARIEHERAMRSLEEDLAFETASREFDRREAQSPGSGFVAPIYTRMSDFTPRAKPNDSLRDVNSKLQEKHSPHATVFADQFLIQTLPGQYDNQAKPKRQSAKRTKLIRR
jgi:DNA-binding Lrp family transcriptional regulator